MPLHKISFAFHFSLLVYVFLYFMMNNLFEYSLQCYICSFAIITVYFILILLAYFLLPKKFSLYTYLILFGFGFYALLMSTFLQNQEPVIGDATAILICYFILSLCLIIRKFALDKVAFVIVLIMSCLHIASHTENIKSLFLSKQPQAPIQTQNIPLFAHKPNVYLFIMESYQGQEALTKIYNFENESFYHYLQENDFKIYNDFYAVCPTTRASIFSLLTYKSDINTSTATVSDILKQKTPSTVIDTFRENGYQIKYHFPNEYLVHTQKHLFTNFLPQIKLIRKYRTDIDFLKEVSLKIDEFGKSSVPFLSIIKIGGITEDDNTYTGGVAHIPNNLRRTDQLEQIPALRKNYLHEMVRQNELTKDILRQVISNDPQSVIILVGDHGPLFYEIWKEKGNFNHYHVSEEEYLLDRYNVLGAIRLPADMTSSEEIHFVPEVFQLIFAKLSHQPFQNADITTLYDFKNTTHDISDWKDIKK